MLRSDNGTGYTSELFNKFYKDVGIEHQLITPYTPQQNRVVEQKNRTIVEMTRCLLHDKDLPKMSFFLGMQIKHNQSEIFVTQSKYAKEILKKFKIEDYRPTNTPMNQKEKFNKEDGAAKVEEELYISLIKCLM